jgi:TonB family protein
MPSPPRAEERAGLFEAPAAAAKAEPARPVKTAGFDDSTANRAATVRGNVLSSAFGDTIASQPGRLNPGRATPAPFESVAIATAEHRAPSQATAYRPIEILEKPVPQYTEEGRRLRIQGAVVLEVLFRASAEVFVLRVVRGLGHGLDASAEKAALGIRFHPAAESGRAVDSIATVKIEFQLAD